MSGIFCLALVCLFITLPSKAYASDNVENGSTVGTLTVKNAQNKSIAHIETSLDKEGNAVTKIETTSINPMTRSINNLQDAVIVNEVSDRD